MQVPMIAYITAKHISPAGVVFVIGIALLGSAALWALAMGVNKFYTRNWESPANANYLSSVKQAFYQAYRAKWATYAILGMAVAGVFLMIVALFMRIV